MKSYLIFLGYFKTSLHFYFSAQNQLRIKFAENCFEFTFFFYSVKYNIGDPIAVHISNSNFQTNIVSVTSFHLLYLFCPTTF